MQPQPLSPSFGEQLRLHTSHILLSGRKADERKLLKEKKASEIDSSVRPRILIGPPVIVS